MGNRSVLCVGCFLILSAAASGVAQPPGGPPRGQGPNQSPGRVHALQQRSRQQTQQAAQAAQAAQRRRHNGRLRQPSVPRQHRGARPTHPSTPRMHFNSPRARRSGSCRRRCRWRQEPTGNPEPPRQRRLGNASPMRVFRPRRRSATDLPKPPRRRCVTGTNTSGGTANTRPAWHIVWRKSPDCVTPLWRRVMSVFWPQLTRWKSRSAGSCARCGPWDRRIRVFIPSRRVSPTATRMGRTRHRRVSVSGVNGHPLIRCNAART